MLVLKLLLAKVIIKCGRFLTTVPGLMVGEGNEHIKPGLT